MLRANHNMAEAFLPARQDITNNLTNNSYPTYNYTTNVTGMGAKILMAAGSVTFTAAVSRVLVLFSTALTRGKHLAPGESLPDTYTGTITVSSDGKTVTWSDGPSAYAPCVIIPIYT